MVRIRQGTQRGPACRPLRVGTHNLGGIQLPHREAVLQAAASQWARMRLDVVCLQETHHTGEGQSRLLQRGLNAAAKRLGTPGWVIVAESFTPNPRTAGVAILVRSDLSQVVSPVEVPLRMKPEEAPPGRFLQYSFTWGGHRVHLANIYMPTAAYAAQRKDFIRKTLTPVYAAAREDDQLLWVGVRYPVPGHGRYLPSAAP